ncbi:MAG: TrkA family potassium uptake protein [Planctomycetes bacterium]|nr:TrkA family potassium uptake protein [Planctomycetota bacterium]
MIRKVLIIGAGQFGRALALGLVEGGADVSVLDPREDRIAAVSSAVSQAIIGSGTDERVLRGLDIETFDQVVNAIGEESLESSIVCTQLLREFGAREVIARVVSDLHKRIVESLGVTRTVHPEEDAAKGLARRIVRPELRSELELAEGARFLELDLPEKWIGKTLQDIDLRKRHGVSVVAVRRGAEGGRRLVSSPSPEDAFLRGDELMIVGPKDSVDRVLKELG